MKKKGSIAVFIILFFLINLKLACAIGITPTRVDLNFQPGLNYSVTCHVIEENPEREIEISVEGNLADYVELDREEFKGGGSFTVTLRLPDKINTPGPNIITLWAREKEKKGSMVGTATAINSAIIVFVPYPGRYAEMLSFSVDDVNVGEPLIFKTELINHGEESVITNVKVEVYREDKKIDEIDIGEELLRTHQKAILTKEINSSKYGPGSYKAVAILDYGDPDRIPKSEKVFRIGSLFVDITNWTREFYVGEINNFIVEVESEWNNIIRGVYANVFIYNKTNNSLLKEFKTAPEDLEGWHRKNLTGYLEAVGIAPDFYKANITVFYETKTTTKITDIKGVERVVKKKLKALYVIIPMVFVLILIVVILIIRHKRKKTKK